MPDAPDVFGAMQTRYILYPSMLRTAIVDGIDIDCIMNKQQHHVLSYKYKCKCIYHALFLLVVILVLHPRETFAFSLTVQVHPMSSYAGKASTITSSRPSAARLTNFRSEKEKNPRRRRLDLISSSTQPQAALSSSTSLSSSTVPLKDNSNDESRPAWACDWMPTWLVTMRPALQLVVALSLYVFHLTVLTQHSIAFPIQLFPNDRGHFQSIGWDSVAGILSLLGGMYLSRATRHKATPAVPPLWSSPTRNEAPWRFKKSRANKLVTSPGARTTSIVGFIALVQAYFFTGRFSIFWEDFLYAAAGMGVSMTIAMHRSLCVLLGHLTWIALGGAILGFIPRPQPFYGGGQKKVQTKESGGKNIKVKKTTRTFRWYTSKWDTYWLWWTIGGYFVSSWVFNIADFVNQIVLPAAIFDTAAEGVVSQLINPENNDLFASLVGYIAPCITAPWWEEVLYRGFMLPAMCLHMKYPLAVFLSGVVFSAHHLSATGAIPLAFLGWAWAAMYAKSGNLLVTILIHAMWNSRVFLGSWLGL